MIKDYYQNIPDVSNFKSYLDLCKEKAKLLKEEIQSHKIKAINIAFDIDDLKEIEDLADKITKYKKILVIGVGGSSLGGKTLNSLALKANKEKIEFLESIDPATVKCVLQKINFENSFFIVISKSGQTIETICQTLIIIEEIKKVKAENYQQLLSQSFLFITSFKTSSLAQIALQIKAPIIDHPCDIGGRFSYLCVVGLLPAAIAQLDIKKIRNGAKKIIEQFVNEDSNSIIEACAIQLYLYDQGFNNNVIMPYIDNLKNFTDWYRQLLAESVGKKSFGATPINSMGTIDQHSQLQLYLDGPRNKFFTFISQQNHSDDFLIKDLKNVSTLFGGKRLREILKIEQETTIEVLNQRKIPIRNFIFDYLNEETLSAFMMRMFLEVILISYVKNINPFDQPEVELRKDLARKILI
jgi:glucose-6-phosphate isomerase